MVDKSHLNVAILVLQGVGSLVGREGDKAAVLVWCVFAGFHMWRYPASGFGDKNHPVAEYNGYTISHLPKFDRSPEFPRKTDAILASFAARIAFSSFVMRS